MQLKFWLGIGEHLRFYLRIIQAQNVDAILDKVLEIDLNTSCVFPFLSILTHHFFPELQPSSDLCFTVIRVIFPKHKLALIPLLLKTPQFLTRTFRMKFQTL